MKGQIERRANRKLAARDSLAEALAVFEDLGSPPWAQRARDEIARLGLRHRAADELTESERRIAELAAAGMTNRQVAEAAFVSPKTVEANLARVYQKLGIRSRADSAPEWRPGRGRARPNRRETPDVSAHRRAIASTPSSRRTKPSGAPDLARRALSTQLHPRPTSSRALGVASAG